MSQQLLSATELAARLSVTKGRVSQYVAQGKLNGCFAGDGRARRFDLAKVCGALGRNLDLGQMMGNGAATRRTIAALRAGIDDDADDSADPAPASAPRAKESAELPRGDSARYEMARTARAEEDLRAARLRNGREEGLYVLASEVELSIERVMAQEVAEMEAVLRDGARLIADKMGVDFRTARQLLRDTWRDHRSKRAGALVEQAEAAGPSPAEQEQDI
ncbi:MAG: hypothetical protein V4659_03925 [Pseudomonadota bacterium]